jgi:hypothetical protein
MKKEILLTIPLMLIEIVSAQPLKEIEYTIKNLMTNPQENLIFFQILLFIIVLALVHTALTKTKIFEDKKISAIISLAVSLLSVYYLTQEKIFEYILPYYGSLGLGAILIFPLLIILFLIHRSEINQIGRKAIIGIYSAFFAYFWYKNYLSTGDFWNEIYLITAGILIIVFYFDKHVHEALKKKSS